jgi:hypothetical protein
LWKKINWKGSIVGENVADRPSDDAFKKHFEALLNPHETSVTREPLAQIPPLLHLPVTDDPITYHEVIQAIKSLKAGKAGGPSGIPPGLLKHLPDQWIAFLTHLFNAILTAAAYPSEWNLTKLVTLFKKGSQSSCSNYRGISLMDSLAKIYDIVLNRRLTLWFQPDREQAGAQRGRGCSEHLLTLRLLIDYARHKKKTLYLVFVNFSKAYDRVPRDLMLKKIKEMGCGGTMTNAIAAAYQKTEMILRSTTITTSTGVRQGSPTSCLLFTLVVNDLIRQLKTRCEPDGFLGKTHSLMLMDDTILLSTSREKIEQKIAILLEFCDQSGMVINEDKTKFMTINGLEADRSSLIVGTSTIRNCDRYTYLGAIYTQDGQVNSAIRAQCQSKMCHVVKFEAFIKKNSDMPFPMKRKVFESALISSILYGCESWLSNSAATIVGPAYMSCVRLLLGVRKTTACDLSLIEAGLPTLAARLKTTQKRCIEKLWDERREMADDPLAYALQLAKDGRTPCARYIDSLNQFSEEAARDALIARVRASTRTKYKTYVEINPTLTTHEMYGSTHVAEHKRIAFTKLRLSSHNLAVERGRWTRVPRDQRLCQLCDSGEIQDEHHILTRCPATNDVRTRFPQVNFSVPDFFEIDVNILANLCYTLMNNFI